MRKETERRVLAIDPVSRGVGYVVHEGQDKLIAWGVKTTEKADNTKSAFVIDRLIDKFRPDVLVLENWNANGSRRRSRVEELLKRIAAKEGRRVLVQLVTNREIRAIGQLPLTGTKYGRATFLAERFPELEPYLPPIRKTWMSEDERMAIFDALSFAVAYVRTTKKTAPLALPPPNGSV